jgi:peptidoglycan hydrolase-like protein with peptidoglycan-binding domain
MMLTIPFHAYAQTPQQCFENPSLCQNQPTSKKAPKAPTVVKDFVEIFFSGLDLLERKKIQRSLADLGLYDSEVDGIYGRSTKSALELYIKDNNIKKSSYDEFRLALLGLVDASVSTATVSDQISNAEIESANIKIKEQAMLFISDVETYVSSGQSSFDLNFAIEYGKVRDIAEDKWSPSLQAAFNSFREYALTESGFRDFHNTRNEERQIAFKEQLSASKKDLFERVALMRTWAQANLLDQRTEAVIKLISSSEKILLTEELSEIEETLTAVKQLSSSVGIAELAPIDPDKASSFVPDSIYLFGNFSGSAPHLFKGISGEPELTGADAEVCLVGALDKWQRYSVVDLLAGNLRAEKITLSDSGCFGSEDVLAILGSRLIEGDLPLSFSAGYEELHRLDRKDTVSIKEKFELVGQVYEDDILKAQKIGFGLLRFDNENETICAIVDQGFADHSSALKSNSEILSLYEAFPDQIAPAADVLDAFRQIQRNDCGFVYGGAEDLATLIEAAKNNKMTYEVLPIWISPETVEQITMMRTEAEKQRLSDQASRENQQTLNEQALQAATQKALVAQGILRSENEVRFSAVIDKLSSGVLTAVEFGFSHSPLDSDYQQVYQDLEIVDATTGKSSAFDPIINDIQSLSLEKWEKTGFILNKTDYGTVEYNGRTLEGVISELQVSLKNRVVGDFITYCRIIRAVNDIDFDMWRQIEISECGSDDGQWRLANRFESKWIVSTEQ